MSDLVVSLWFIGDATNWSIEYSLDGSRWQTYTTPILVSGDGQHSLNVTLYENKTVRALWRESLHIDSVPPQSVAEVEPASEVNGWFNTSPVVRLTGSDSLSGLSGLQYRIDTGTSGNYTDCAWQNCTDGTWKNYTTPVTLPDGIYYFEYRAIDVAGNIEALHRRFVQADTQGPMIYNLSASVFHANQGQVAWHAIDPLSGVAGCAVSLDGGPFTPITNQETFAFSLPDGVHEIDVRATDRVGNVAVLSIPIRIDTNPFSYTGPFGASLTLGLMLAATLLVWFAYSRQMRRMRRG